MAKYIYGTKGFECEKQYTLPLEKFKAVPNPNFPFVPLLVIKDLLNDQKLDMTRTLNPDLIDVPPAVINWLS